MNGVKETLYINKKEFLNWRFQTADDLEYLGSLALVCLLEGTQLDLGIIWIETGYIPVWLVQNSSELTGIEFNHYSDFDVLYPEDYNVIWMD